jgi:hypothetical protein
MGGAHRTLHHSHSFAVRVSTAMSTASRGTRAGHRPQ